jgi:hypothetical protein
MMRIETGSYLDSRALALSGYCTFYCSYSCDGNQLLADERLSSRCRPRRLDQPEDRQRCAVTGGSKAAPPALDLGWVNRTRIMRRRGDVKLQAFGVRIVKRTARPRRAAVHSSLRRPWRIAPELSLPAPAEPRCLSGGS